MESILVLRDVEAGEGPSTLKATTPAPARAVVDYTIDGRHRAADMYLPGDSAKAGMVLVPGLTPAGRDDRRLVAFAMTLTRAHFEVIVPDLPRMRALQVTSADAEPIADAARYMRSRNGSRPLGLAAVSFAVGPALLALLELPQPSPIGLFLGIGGYYDLPALITYVTTGFFRGNDGEWQFQPPKRYGKWVFVLSNAGRLSGNNDRLTLLEMANRKLDDADADVSDLVPLLGPQGEAVYALVTNADPQRVPFLLAALPPEVQESIEALDLRRRPLDAPDTRFVLIHDRGDRIIPAGQTTALAAALLTRQVQVCIVDGLDHAQVKSLTLGGALKLIDAIATVLRFRDGDRPLSAP